jgi:type I restriction enzyme S subunit
MSRQWPDVRLGDVLKSINRPEAVDPEKAYKVLGAHWYAEGLYVKEMLTGAEIQAPKVYRVEEGDFVYNRLFAWKGSFALASKEEHDCYVSNEFPCFQVRPDKLDRRYLWRYFSRQSVWTEALGLSKGGTPTSRNRLKEEAFLTMKIVLPPLEEQQRIVAKIDALAGKIEEAKRLREEGTNQTNLLFDREVAGIFRQDRWRSQPLGKLLTEESRNGLGARPTDEPPGTPILRISAATTRPDAIINEADHKYMEVGSNELQTYRLQPGDLLACRFNGNLHYVGRFALYRHEAGQDRVYPDKLIRFRVDRTRVLPEFVRYAMNSPSGREIIESFCTTTAGNIGVSATELKTVSVPVPTIQEQQQISQHLDDLCEQIARIHRFGTNTGKELDALLPAILDRAFKGEL